MKIIGIGLNKTGTTTLGNCFEILGFSHIGCEPFAFDMYKNGDMEGLFNTIRKYDSFEDWPWPMIYTEIDKHFPECKFILTVRSSPDVWFDSLCKYAKRSGPTDYRKVIYGYDMPQGYRDHHIAFYKNHNNSVREYFKNRPEIFLEICWESGHGWKELCSFLNKDIPDMELPHANKYSKIKGALKPIYLRAKRFFPRKSNC